MPGPRGFLAGSPTSVLRRLAITAVALPTAVALTSPVAFAQSGGVPRVRDTSVQNSLAATAGVSTPPPVGKTAPSGVRLDKVEWITDRRVALWVGSPAMGQAVQVQLLLPREWNSRPDQSFPTLLLLDGLRARDDASGWTLETKIDSFFADKDAIVVLPVGGQSSFYTNWETQAKGASYQWETFLIDELPGVLSERWRTNGTRAVAGLSMGGTGAVMLAERHPDHFKFGGSFSGYLDPTSFGMAEAIRVAMQDAGGYNPDDMWGPIASDRWRSQDPKLNVEKLKGISVYVSSGSGNTGPWDEPSLIPNIPTNYPGYGLELLTRMTSQTFVNRARSAGVNVTANFRPSGTHSWPYWQFELTQAWPQIAEAVGVGATGPTCTTKGAIADALEHLSLGRCVTDEYNVGGGGVAQDFLGGRMFWSRDTDAHEVVGRIGAAYQASGGTEGGLGLPISGERILPDGTGRYSEFTNGVVYWSPLTGAHAVSGAIRAGWSAQNTESGHWGYPITDAIATPNKDGVSQGFASGVVWSGLKTGAHMVEGRILDKYRAIGAENSELGFPVSSEIGLVGGALSRFETGQIYWSRAGAFVIPAGPIFEEWGDQSYENGPLGYPISDQKTVKGAPQVDFENGSLRYVGGKVVRT